MLKSEVGAQQIAGLQYQFYLPDNLSPLAKPIYLIHGRGGNSDVMWIFSKAFAGLNRPIFAPQAPVLDTEIGGWNWWKLGDKVDFKNKVENLDNFIIEIEKLYGLKGAPRTLCGFSQGAAMSMMYTLLKPNKVTSAICLGGFIPKSFEFEPEDLSGIKVFVGHGTNDEILPLNRADEVAEMVTLLGAETTKSYADVGHKVGSLTITDLTEWNKKEECSVTIFDDDPDVHEELGEKLTNLGVKYYSASNFSEAVKLLNYKSSLFVVDLFIEGDTEQTTSFVRKYLKPRGIPFIRYSSAPHMIEKQDQGLGVFPKRLKNVSGSIGEYLNKNLL